METEFKIKNDKFQGPLDLLLNLIEKRKLFINEISLAKISDDYIEYLKQLGKFPVAESSQFILIASTLLLIKSKSLLPTLDLTLEEQESVHDLEHRLKLYKQIRDLSENIKERFGKSIIFEKNPLKNLETFFSPDNSISTSALLNSLKEVIKNIPKKESLPEKVVRKVISLEEMIDSLTDRIKSNLKMSFRDFANSHGQKKIGREEKVHVIVSFLAMLELVKQGVIMVSQEKEYDDISIETQNIGVPRYN